MLTYDVEKCFNNICVCNFMQNLVKFYFVYAKYTN